MTAKTLMIQGTSSSAGKSLLTAAFCRVFARKGVRVAPFKAQNMSNNAAVCAEGGEIGRSQAMQATAAGTSSKPDMNPILLKPESDTRSQVILRGRNWKTLAARTYYKCRNQLWPVVTTSLDRLRNEYELVVIEGAGSPAELNLQETEIVNMAVARYAGSPVILVGDIERGGVFAQLLGTLWLLSHEERKLVRGLVVNKFRGDPSLFTTGLTLLQDRSGVPVLGVVPWLPRLRLPEEGTVALDSLVDRRTSANSLDIVVVRLPHIANFDDFDPIAEEPGVGLRYVDSEESLGHPDAIILPGTKSTMADLAWLRHVGLAHRIEQLASQYISVVGICGGFQMLGQIIRDPECVESTTTKAGGLRLLRGETVFARTKQSNRVQATVMYDVHCPGCQHQTLCGYEIHMAQTHGGTPWLRIIERNGQTASESDGDVSDSGLIWGCYLHGLFANDDFRRAWLRSLRTSNRPPKHSGGKRFVDIQTNDSSISLDDSLNQLADGVEAALNIEQLEKIVWG